MKLSDNTSISLPARNLLAILAAVAIGTMSYFSVIERLNKIETEQQKLELGIMQPLRWGTQLNLNLAQNLTQTKIK